MAVIEVQLTGIECFIRLPEFKPAMDYYDGRAIQKMPPKLRHSIIQGRMFWKLEAHIESIKDGGGTYPGLRCTFRKKSFVFDLSCFRESRIPKLSDDDRADVIDPPDQAIEILSPGQSVGKLRRKFRPAVRGGVGLGWLIDPIHQPIMIFRPRRKTVTLRPGGTLSGESALPGFGLPVDEVFGWPR